MAGGSFIGLDIGSNLMKVVELRRSGKGMEIMAMGLKATPPDAFENSVISDLQMLSKAVKELLKEAGCSTNRCVTSISGQSAVVVRVIEVPQMGPKELDEAMKFEVERHVPFAGGGSDVITDYVTIDRPEGYADGQNMEVLLAAAPQDIIDRHVEMLKASGLKPVAIDVEPLAVGRTLLELTGTGAEQPGHTVAIINIGASVTEISIYRDKLLTFSRTLPMAGDNFTRAIADNLQVDLDTAEKYKRDMGEVILDGSTQPHAYQQQPGTMQGGGGFVDFSNPDNPPVPTATTDASPSGRTPFAINTGPITGGTGSPSGRMPFDFSTPGTEQPSQPMGAPAQMDLSGQPAPTNSGLVESDSGSLPAADHGFFTPPPVSHPVQNLPAHIPGDTAGDALKGQIFNALSQVLVELSQELRRSLDYYRSKSADAPVHEILLVGGTAKLRNMAPYLEVELGNIPTRVADPMQNLTVVSKRYPADQLAEIASLFPVSIGLAARDLIDIPNPKGKKRR